MAAGFACMNDLTVQQASQGLCAYLEKVEPQLRTKGVVVGCDARHHSRDFARITAAVFLHRGVPVYLFRDICATPHVPFCLTHKGCAAGVMVTASHNPKADNGYKVYWDNGSQIIPPHDAGIAACIDANQEPWPCAGTLCDTSPLCKDPVAEGVLAAYFEQTSARLCRMRNVMDPLLRPPIRFAYTAMHGVGYNFARQMFDAFGLIKGIFPIEEQIQPNPEFPTVAFPNPEERGALNIAMARAGEAGVNLIVANDPDADRVAVAERQPSGEWKQFTGDEIGFVLAAWSWNQWRERNPDANPARVAMLNSAVSSKALKAIAEREGFHYEETLTGFKWLGNRTEQLAKEGYTVLFAYEEAIGYMPCDLIRDKDGLTTAAVIVEIATWLANQHKNLAGYIQEARQRYGVFVPQNSYFLCYDPATVARIFARLRTAGPGGKYMDTCAIDGQSFRAVSIRDLKTPGYDSTREDKKPVLPVSSGGEMITYTFENGATITLRTSGTEPKLKYYCEMSAPYPASPKDTLATLVRAMIATFLEPELNGLQPPH